MIIKCPECATAFDVEESLLAPDGRKVRCKSCQNVWFQEYVTQQDDEDDRESLAEDMPDEEGSEVPSFLNELSNEVTQSDDHDGPEADDFDDEDRVSFAQKLKEKMASLIENVKAVADIHTLKTNLTSKKALRATGLLTGLILSAFISSHLLMTSRDETILKYPWLYDVYSYIGYDVVPSGQDLRLKNIEPEWGFAADGKAELTLTGKIVNLADEARHIPPLKATYILESGEASDSVIMSVEPNIIEGNGTQELHFVIREWPESAQDVLLSLDVDSIN